MADKKLFFTVGADVAPGSKAFSQLARDAKKSMGDVDSAVDDTRTNAQKVADALDGVFESVDASMMETKATAEVLAQALGPELSAKVDSTAAVAEFQKLGLSLDEIKADADRLADTLKKADDVSLKHLGGEADIAGGKLKGVHEGADQSRSVLANMVGNSAQDLGQLSGVAGSAGVALGQVAEYAADGSLSLSGMAKVGGPMIALGIAVAAVAAHMKDVAATKAFNKERVQGFVDALEDGVVAAGELQKILAGKETSGIFVRWRNETVDVEEAVQQFFGTFKDFKALTDKGMPGFDLWADQQLAAAEASGASAVEMHNLRAAFDDVRDGSITGRAATNAMADGNEALLQTALALASAISSQSKATGELSVDTAFYGETSDEAATAAQEAGNAAFVSAKKMEINADRAERLARAQEEAAAEAEQHADDLRKLSDALDENGDAAQDAADATLDLKDAQARFNEVAKDSDAALTDIVRAAKAAADAETEHDRATMLAAGSVRTKTQSLDVNNRALLDQAAQLKGPQRQAILDYVAELNGIPPEKVSEIAADLNQGSVDQVNVALSGVSATRTSYVKAEALTGDADRTIRNMGPYSTTLTVTPRKGGGIEWIGPGGQRMAMYAKGGTVGAGGGLAGENFKPEAVNGTMVVAPTLVPPGAHVTGEAATARLLEGAARGNTIHVTVNMPPGSDGRDVVNQIKKYERVNGPGWRR